MVGTGWDDSLFEIMVKHFEIGEGEGSLTFDRAMQKLQYPDKVQFNFDCYFPDVLII